MIAKHKNISIMSLLFAVMIVALIVSLVNKFTIIDLAYLLFIVGCFIRYIYIKTH